MVIHQLIGHGQGVGLAPAIIGNGQDFAFVGSGVHVQPVFARAESVGLVPQQINDARRHISHFQADPEGGCVDGDFIDDILSLRRGYWLG